MGQVRTQDVERGVNNPMADDEARRIVEARWPLPPLPPQSAAERWVMCMGCGSWKKLVPGNHHPWCGCGSDVFNWGDERDRNPEATG